MYSVVIADDEEELRTALVNTVDWGSIGFEIVAQAENGAEALEMVEKYEPDLLLTDIKMPFVGGIELARKVREIRPSTNIAFLSGYDDFSFAQQAIQYNILSYLLKPISKEEITEALLKIRQKIDKKNDEIRAASKKENEQKYTDEHLLMSLLMDNSETGQDDGSYFEDLALSHRFKKSVDDNPCYMVIAVRIENKNGENITVPGHIVPINAILSKYVRYGSFYSNGKIICLIAENKWELLEYINILVEEISQTIERVMGCKCFIGVSRSTFNVKKCNVCFNEAVTALTYSGSMETSAHFIEDMEKEAYFEYDYVKEAIKELENRLKTGTKDEMVAFLDRLFAEISVKNFSKMEVNLLVMQIISSVCQAVATVSGSNSATEFLTKSSFMGSVLGNAVGDRIRDEIIRFCLLAKDVILEQRRMNSEVVCDDVIKIIDEKFADEKLSLGIISETLHISPNYLSALIKKQKNSTFTNLLTEKRMNSAKDLLLCTSMKIMEIAQKCGYSDQHYFSYCFKKFFGISPNKMREN